MLSRIATEDLKDDIDSTHQLEYFDEKERIWLKLSKTAVCAGRVSLVVAGENLYAIGSSYNGDMLDSSYNEDIIPGDGFKYDTKQNIWEQLPPMMEPHGSNPQVVYSDGYIYVFGNPVYSGSAECYSVAEQNWELLPNLPNPYYNCSSAIVYDGNILVCDYNVFEDKTHSIYGYNPNINSWQIVLPQSNTSSIVGPVLFQYQDQVYRVMYRERENEQSPNHMIPVVNKLNMQSYHDDGRISVGEEVNQETVTGNEIGAFYIQDQVFVNTKGFIQATDLKMNHGKADDPVSERMWAEFCRHVFDSDAGNIACFTFDKKNLI